MTCTFGSAANVCTASFVSLCGPAILRVSSITMCRLRRISVVDLLGDEKQRFLVLLKRLCVMRIDEERFLASIESFFALWLDYKNTTCIL